MTITLSRCRSSSMCSKNVIRRSLGRSSSEATFPTAVIAAKKARLIYFPQMRTSPTASEGVAVFRQRIRGVAVPSDFPVSELFFIGEGDRTNPLRALVRIALRHEEPHRSAVFDREGFPDRTRRTCAAPRPEALRIQEREVGSCGHLHRRRRARILGSPRVQQHRGSVDGRPLLLLM